jgi:hypothetical protein
MAKSKKRMCNIIGKVSTINNIEKQIENINLYSFVINDKYIFIYQTVGTNWYAKSTHPCPIFNYKNNFSTYSVLIHEYWVRHESWSTRYLRVVEK